jgi:hypothetical protein
MNVNSWSSVVRNSWSSETTTTASTNIAVDVSSWRALLVKPQPVYTRKMMCKNKRRHGIVQKKKQKKTNKKQKRRHANPEISLFKFPIVSGPTALASVLPTNGKDMQESVLNHLAQVLPLECRVKFSGSWHPFVLVGVFYRYNKLTWIMLSRNNFKLYLSCHWNADSTHLFESLRPDIKLDNHDQERKWNRQGFNQVCCVFQTQKDYDENIGLKLVDLPSAVLQATGTFYNLGKVKEFISTKDFVSNFKRSLTQDFSPLLGDTVQSTRGWKIFGKTDPLKGECGGGKRRLCKCSQYIDTIKESFRVDEVITYKKAVAAISYFCPSTLYTSKKGLELTLRYTAFVTFAQANPKTMFFPN